MKLAVYATGGHTEVLGLGRFLARAAPTAEVSRRLPRLAKPGPKRTASARPAGHPGQTGRDLIADAARDLERNPGTWDAVLLWDDGDCRFGCAAGPEWTTWSARVTKRLREAAGRPELPVYIVLAAPEIEAWFIADFARGFGHRGYLEEAFRGTPNALKVVRDVLDATTAAHAKDIEAFGCPRPPTGGCDPKLSDALTDALRVAGGRYRKTVDGGPMLQRLDPAVIADRCPRFARHVLRRLAADFADG